MKTILTLLFVCGGLYAQSPISFAVCDTNCSSLTPLGSVYQFPDTAQAAENVIELVPINSSGSTIELISVSINDTQNFSVTNVYVDAQIAPGKSAPPFYVHFAPQKTGSITGYMTAIYCSPSGSDNTCATSLSENAATFQGNGTAPQTVLSCSGAPQQCGASALTPGNTIDFGNVSDGSSASATFTLANNSQSPLATQNLVTLKTAVFNTTPFALDALSIPATLAAGATANFKVTFSPGQAALMQATLVVGGSSFPLQGTGVANVLGDISSLVVTYTDPTGVRLTAQGGSPINFPQVVAGTSGTAALNFVVSNPQTTIGAVNIPSISVSGSAFTVSGLPTMPASIQPGGTLAFQLTFAASAAGSYSGTLSIGTLQFALAGQSVLSPLPSMSFQLSEQPLTSQQQVNLTIQLASASTIPAVGTLTMTFAPSVQNVSDDPAIKFLATNGRHVNVSVAAGSQTATYNSQSALAFQTGTTAGTITFTLEFPDTAPMTQSFTIVPDKVHISTASATISSPNLVITINGYDNTYSTGQLSFTFYDTKGNTIAPGALAVNATPQFQQYFFNTNQAGGAFALQASFPVSNGDATQVGSVSITMNNSAGAATITQTFQ